MVCWPARLLALWNCSNMWQRVETGGRGATGLQHTRAAGKYILPVHTGG